MEEQYLYLRIADSLRRDIADGNYNPGDPLPSMRSMATAWQCTIGTVQRAIRELESESLVSAHVGARTRVTAVITPSPDDTLQRANLIHRAETFLLEAMTAGFSTDVVEDAFRTALNRWRSVSRPYTDVGAKLLRFSGSHDLAVAWLATHFAEIAPGYRLQLGFSGSQGGVLALQKGEAEIAGAHLLDERTGSYNLPVVQQLFPGERIALVTLARRRIGFIVKPGNSKKIQGVQDLLRPEIHFINRQAGSGTRVLLDTLLREEGLPAAAISGYEDEKSTHSEVAAAVAEGRADTGIGLEAAAKAYNLDFVFITLERYDLLIREVDIERMPVQQLLTFLKTPDFRQLLERLGGYDSRESGSLRWSG
jgi:molybdate-binding protein/DNA-binding transcriptional regulator YhcF (GntR family)